MLPRKAALPWLICLAALLLAAWVWWPRANDDVLGSAMASFERQNRLLVFTARLSPVVTADSESLLGMLKVKQVAVIPARVDYTVDLSDMTRDRLSWDEKRRRLEVRLPAPVPGKPNMDEAHAQYLREGVWITRTTQDRLTRENTAAAERQASAEATGPVLAGLAREAARDALRQNLAIPLGAAGHGAVAVIVRFDGEGAQ